LAAVAYGPLAHPALASHGLPDFACLGFGLALIVTPLEVMAAFSAVLTGSWLVSD
jgi:hypothetical protein